jgi:hypothetical protein
MELEGLPRGEEVARALINRGICLSAQGDMTGAIRDLTAVVDFADIGPQLQAVGLINRAQMYASLGQRDQAFEDAIAVAGNTVCASRLRALAFVAAARVSLSDQRRVERLCSDAKAFVTSLAPEKRKESMLELLSGLASPDTAAVWLSVWRAVGRDQAPDLLSSLVFLDAVADVLEGRDRSVLNPLPPEQREFASEILRKLQPPTDAKDSG